MKKVIAISALILMTLIISKVQADDVKVCTDRSTYPPKVVIVHKTAQCPAGYY